MFFSFIATPFAKYNNISDKRPPHPSPSPALDEIYRSCRGKPKEKHIALGVEKTGKSVSDVQRWFRLRRALHQPTKLSKMSEAMWRCLFYTSSTIYGYLILKDTAWYKDTSYCWVCFTMVFILDLSTVFTLFSTTERWNYLTSLEHLPHVLFL